MGKLFALLGGFLLVVLSACTEQHDPRRDWQVFRKERAAANRPQPRLTEDFKIPAAAAPQASAETGNPIDKKYANFCSSCHGPEGKGDGAAGMALNPKPRDFVTWKDDVTEEYVAKVIREGGTAVGKSASMAPWKGILSEEEITAMAKKVLAFRK